MPDNARPRGTWFERHPATTLITLVLAFAVAVDLAALRIFLEPKTFSFRSRHPYYHHTLVPGFSGAARWGDIEYPMVTDSLGFRDSAARQVSLRPAGTRVVFIGDSVVEALGVPYAESFIGVLAAEPARKDVELLNAAALSYSPTIYYLKTKFLLENVGLRFDELFVFIDITDIQDEIRYKSFTPRLPALLDRVSLAVDGALYRNSFAYHTLYERLVRPREKRIETVFDPERWSHRDIAVSGLSYSDEDRRRMEAVPEPENGRWHWTIDPEAFRQWGEEGLKIAGSHMEALARLCRDRGIRLTLVVYPAPLQIYAHDLDSLQVRYWERFARDNGASFVNLFPAFIGTATPDPDATYRKYFIANDTHFNAEGHRYLARLLDAYVPPRRAAP
ncbi:MAG TPA: hypothetical protein VI078_01685 [bacterium]